MADQSEEKIIRIRVNDRIHKVKANPQMPLLYFLRNQLNLYGPKYGCGLAQCGSCMVLIDGSAMPSCFVPLSDVENKEIVTLEGLKSRNGTLHPVQQAFIDEQAAQCGYCTNGMIITAVALLDQNRNPDVTSIKAGMQKNLCRCGTQARIINAIKQAAQNL